MAVVAGDSCSLRPSASPTASSCTACVEATATGVAHGWTDAQRSQLRRVINAATSMEQARSIEDALRNGEYDRAIAMGEAQSAEGGGADPGARGAES